MEHPINAKEYRKVPTTIWDFIIFVGKEILARKRWALFPVWVLLATIGLLILLGGTSALLPAIYIAF